MVKIYKFEVTKTEEANGKLKEVIVEGHGAWAVFAINKNEKVYLKKGRNVSKLFRGFMLTEARAKFENFAKEKKKKKRKQTKEKEIAKSAEEVFIPNYDRIEKEAWELNEKIKAYKKRHWSKSWTDSAFEVIKTEQNNPIRWQVLDDKDLKWLRTLERGGIEILTSGWLGVIRWDKRKDLKPKLVPQKVEDIKHALRMTKHILDTYKFSRRLKPSELAVLESIEEVIENVNEELKNAGALNRSEKLRLQKKLASVILRIEKCNNENKIELKKQLKKILPLKDRLNRVNPGAMAARTISALNQLNKRFLELELIIPFIAMRRELLILEERRLKLALKNCLIKIRFASRIKLGKQWNKKINSSIGKGLYFLNNVRCSPYWEICNQARLYLYNAKRLLRIKDYSGSGKMLKEAINILETKV